MKKIKKTMSVVLALSLMSSTAVTVSHAEETSTDEVIMKPVDMTAMYNRNSIYHGALSKVLYNEDGSYALDANGKIKQTGVSGAAGYAGAIYYNSFIEGMEGSYTWNTPWSELPEGTTVNRLTTNSGVEFDLKVVDHSVEDVPVIWSNAMDKVKGEYTNFDVEDGYYNAVEILANTNYSGSAENTFIIKLNYTDGSNDSYAKKLVYMANGYSSEGVMTEDGSQAGVKNFRTRSISAAELATLTDEDETNDITELTGDMLNGYATISEYQIPVDTDKQLASFDILNSKYCVVKDAEGNYVKEATGEFKITESANSSANKREHSVAIYAATLLTNEKLELKNLKAGIEAKINDLSDDLSYSDIALYKEIEEEIDNYISLGGSINDIESYAVFAEKYEQIKMLEAVSLPYDMTSMYNVNRIYDSTPTYTGGRAAYSGTIYYDSFISDKYITWKTPWSELGEGAIDNTLISDGVEFNIRVIDSKQNAVTTNCVYWNDNNMVKGEWTTLDVADGKYDTVEILANTDRGNGRKMAVKLNYTDGYDVSEYRLNVLSNPTPDSAVAALLAVRCNTKYTTREELENWAATGIYNKANIGHYRIPVAEGKTLTSVEILNDSYMIAIAEDGTYTISDVVDANADGSLSRTSEKTYTTAVYAVTLTMTKAEMISQKADEINSKINELPDFDAISQNDEELITEIGKLIEEYTALGGVAEEQEFYGIYTYALEMLKNSEPVDINVDLSAYFNRGGVYTTGTTRTLTSAGYPGGFDYEAFKSDEYITWVTPWVDGMTENKLVSDGHTFKMKVVDYGNADKDLSNVIFWNGSGQAGVSGEWTNIDVLDGQYNSIELLANSNRSGLGKTATSTGAEEQAKTLIVRLNYTDGGSEILGTNREYVLNYFANGAAKPNIQSLRHNGSTSKGTIRHLTLPVTYSRTLESVDILNAGYAIDEEGNAVADSKRYDLNGEQLKDKNTGEYLTDGTNHNAVIYAMTLVGTKTSVGNMNAEYIGEIEAKIDSLTNSAADAELMKEIEEMLIVAKDRGIAEEDISNISKYDAEYPYFAKIEDVVITNDNEKAEVVFTFDRTLTDEIIASASFTLGGIELDAEKLSDKAIKVSFEHNMEYSAEYKMAVKVGYATDCYQLVALDEPASVGNVLFYQGEEIINNFHNTTNGTFTVKADVNTYSGETVMLALYNGNTLNAVKKATVTDGKVSCDFTVSKEMDENWVLKAIVWDSLTGMIPQNKAKVLNKTYGYDNFTDLTKDLTVVYFGDSQTEGKMFTTPLTGALEVQREDYDATVTAYNAGQGGTAINLGMYRLDSEVIAHNPDIVFVEFYPNDSNISSKGETTAAALAKDADLLAYHENVIKRLLALDHVPMIIYMNPMKEPTAAGVVSNYYSYNVIKPLLDYYGIPAMDFQKEAERLIATGDYTWDNFRKSTSDVHFTKEGGEICAAWMYGLMTDDETKDTYVKKATLGLPDYQAIQYEHPQMISSHYGIYDNKWEITSLATATEGYNVPVTGDAFPNEYMAATEVGAEMTFTFKGRSLYIYTLIGAYGGKAEYEIDGIYKGTIDTYSTNSKSMYKSAKAVKTGLEDTEHTVTIRVVEPNSAVKSEKAYFGIGKFMVERN